jgi:hypothetical protein
MKMICGVSLDIYDTVIHPDSAINILGMLIGAGEIVRAEGSRKGIGDVAAALGSIFKKNDDTLRNIIEVCRR